LQVTGPAWVLLENVPGARADIRAKVVDFNETGLRIHVSLLLEVGHVLVVKGRAVGVVPDGLARGRVVDCQALSGSGYSVGLTFERAGDSLRQPEPPAPEAYKIHTMNPNGKQGVRGWDEDEAAAVKELEKAKRRGILELLYTARRTQPRRATVSLPELEELLGCPREHLDFSVWYLTESALITGAEHERYSITAKGVDHLECEDERAAEE
jgi:hypothetical protein